ncbi:MAG: cryptochrome/photolyase family protein [Phycisphaeraceae bacterium]|nr:cryptochrome/photolyase family protein [Phycisphaeraceae bacterium]
MSKRSAPTRPTNPTAAAPTPAWTSFAKTHIAAPVRNLIIILGDQLAHDSPTLSDLDPALDAILMMEVIGESTHVPSHRQRTILFLSAMRHHALRLHAQGVRVRYITLDDPDNSGTIDGEVRRAVADLRPERLTLVEPGEHRLIADAHAWRTSLALPVAMLEDSHFLTTHNQFASWAAGRRDLVMEFFYREQRRRLNLLMDGNKPVGGEWNLDIQNRLPFGKSGPKPPPPPPLRFPPDEITRDVIALIARHLPDLPGDASSFAWPVTREHALAALDDFITNRLPLFGPYEDAMWTGEPFLYHSLLSAPLNLKLLLPHECIDAAIRAYDDGLAPLQSVEGFVRQICGWREFIRGIYHLEGPAYETRNWLGHTGSLPEFYWTGQTDMACLSHCITQVLNHGFGHHIQRLMVTGNFALLAGVHPKAVSDWYLGMYVDAIDWVTLPNTLGMSQHADGTPDEPPVVGTKPYISSGQYIARMSNYCTTCRYDPAKRTGDNACPFTVLYWDFLDRHRERLATNRRMTMMLKNLDRISTNERAELRISASRIKRRYGV